MGWRLPRRRLGPIGATRGRRLIALPLALTALSALLYDMGFPPASFAALAWVSLVPFLIAVARVRPLAAAGLGMVWGLLAAFGVTWWFPAMVSAYFASTPALGWLVWLGFSTGFAAIWFAAFAAWTSWAAAAGWASPLLVAAAWGACEVARARVLVGDPWALSAYSQAHWLEVLQIADLTGPYGPGMLLAAVNACIAAAFVPALRGRNPVRSLMIVAATFLGTLLYGTWRLGQPMGDGAPLTVAIVQPGYAPSTDVRDLPLARRASDARAAALERQLALTRRALAHRPALVVWPENAVDAYVEEPGAERDALLDAIRALGVDLILGGPAYVYGPAGLRYRNSVYVLRDGRVAGRYDKLHLIPYAEARDGVGGFEAGSHPYALRAAGTLVGTFVCFEAMYPELVRRIAGGGVELLANLSNDAWFAADAPSRLHLDMAAMRAIEQRRWLVRATTTGISAIVDPHGRIVAATRLDEPAVLTGTVLRSRVQTAYARRGDVLAWTAVGLVVVVSLVRFLSERRRRDPLGGA